MCFAPVIETHVAMPSLTETLRRPEGGYLNLKKPIAVMERAMKNNSIIIVVTLLLTLVVNFHSAMGQGYGTDTQNVLTPAAGGMAGVSLALPQDVPAAVFGNPATLAQFQGTQFTIGGGWVEGYPTITNNGALNELNPGHPFSVTSRTQGFAATEIGATQDLRTLNIPGTLGLGLAGLSGLGAEYRGRVPENIGVDDISLGLNNVSSEYMVLGVNIGAGFDLTDRLSAGATLTLGSGFEQLGFVGPLFSSAMVNAYGLRGTFGLDYDLNDCNTIGAFYQTRMDFDFQDAVRFNGTYHDLLVSQPETVGIGLANHSLMDGDLLIAADIYYKVWDNAPLYKDVFVNQWAFAVGSQLTRGKTKYRLGYSYNTNPLNHNVGTSLDGFPVLKDEIQLFQAASMATIDQHRITAGIGRQGFIVPSLDLDVFAGGLLPAADQFGSTRARVTVYYAGLGLTWRYGCCQGQ
jgi:long-chain fatty acid transport protein